MAYIEINTPPFLSRLRRLALHSQGLLQAQQFGRGLNGARRAISHIGYVQIDTISVIERAHNHTLYSRVPNFKPSMFNRMLLEGDIFEYWSHAAAYLPINDFKFSLPYKRAIKSGQVHWFKNPDKKLMSQLLARIRSDGPIRSRDLETTSSNATGWWDWKPAKKALEQLFMQGDLMVKDRDGFQKRYDLTERVLPSGIDSSMPSIEEFASHLIEQQLGCHGFTSLQGITYLRKNPELRQVVKAKIEEGIESGELEPLKLDDGSIFVIQSGTIDARLPRLSNRLQILSPFDNSVIQRKRLKSLFDFDYQIECYVPAAKRRFGYFSLPLLYRGEFIGRMDCKAHRNNAHLEIKALHLEKQNFDQEKLLAAFTEAVASFTPFQGCDSVALTNVYPKRLTAAFKNALKALS